jgi:hypothetical protein
MGFSWGGSVEVAYAAHLKTIHSKTLLAFYCLISRDAPKTGSGRKRRKTDSNRFDFGQTHRTIAAQRRERHALWLLRDNGYEVAGEGANPEPILVRLDEVVSDADVAKMGTTEKAIYDALVAKLKKYWKYDEEEADKSPIVFCEEWEFEFDWCSWEKDDDPDFPMEKKTLPYLVNAAFQTFVEHVFPSQGKCFELTCVEHTGCDGHAGPGAMDEGAYITVKDTRAIPGKRPPSDDDRCDDWLGDRRGGMNIPWGLALTPVAIPKDADQLNAALCVIAQKLGLKLRQQPGLFLITEASGG